MLGKFIENGKKLIEDPSKRTITVSITEEMFNYLFSKQKIKGINNLAVFYEEEGLAIIGDAKKLLVRIPFSILLVPTTATGRKLSFQIIKMKPLNNDSINNLIFKGRPGITYERQIITLDLNQFEKIKRIPIGNIKDFEYKNNMLYCTLGI